MVKVKITNDIKKHLKIVQLCKIYRIKIENMYITDRKRSFKMDKKEKIIKTTFQQEYKTIQHLL